VQGRIEVARYIPVAFVGPGAWPYYAAGALCAVTSVLYFHGWGAAIQAYVFFIGLLPLVLVTALLKRAVGARPFIDTDELTEESRHTLLGLVAVLIAVNMAAVWLLHPVATREFDDRVVMRHLYSAKPGTTTLLRLADHVSTDAGGRVTLFDINRDECAWIFERYAPAAEAVDLGTRRIDLSGLIEMFEQPGQLADACSSAVTMTFQRRTR
jgi:hypothetical protein